MKTMAPVTSTDTVWTGLDILEAEDFDFIRSARVGLLVNQASVNRKMIHAVDLLRRHPGVELCALFGPQHGLWGTTQDNMIEWQSFRDSRLGLPAHSLYGQHRKPTPEMLRDIDHLIIDLPDIGSRYYTFAWTARLCLEACAGQNIPVTVLDRPNPIGGHMMEGPTLSREFRSFVGLYETPIRHAMTMGELLSMINTEEEIGCRLQVVPCRGWLRSSWFDETGLPWVLPSPNMPTLDTATVYPGGCLLEATNISEGRGTTRPFELVGAPFIESYRLADHLNNMALPGVYFRPASFEPTFHKFSGVTCGGVQVAVTCRDEFLPVQTYACLIYAIGELYPESFRWKEPPYEYEYEKMPIDILWGDDSLRMAVEKQTGLSLLSEKMESDIRAFRPLREKYLLYRDS